MGVHSPHGLSYGARGTSSYSATRLSRTCTFSNEAVTFSDATHVRGVVHSVTAQYPTIAVEFNADVPNVQKLVAVSAGDTSNAIFHIPGATVSLIPST